MKSPVQVSFVCSSKMLSFYVNALHYFHNYQFNLEPPNVTTGGTESTNVTQLDVDIGMKPKTFLVCDKTSSS